jgi:hypothetical protein
VGMGDEQIIPADAPIRKLQKYTCHVSDSSSMCINGKPEYSDQILMYEQISYQRISTESPRCRERNRNNELAFWKRKYKQIEKNILGYTIQYSR